MIKPFNHENLFFGELSPDLNLCFGNFPKNKREDLDIVTEAFRARIIHV